MVALAGTATASSPASTAAATTARTAALSSAGVTCEGYLRSPHARLDIDHEADGALLHRWAALQAGQPANGVDQLVRVEGLGQIGVDADAVAATQVGLLRPRREQDDPDLRRLGVGPQPRRRLPPVQPGHHDVEGHDVRPDRLDLVEGVLPVNRGMHLEALELEVDADELADDVVVVYHQDPAVCVLHVWQVTRAPGHLAATSPAERVLVAS